VVICSERDAGCLHNSRLRMVQLMPLHLQTPSSLASFKFRLVFPFWYQLTQVVHEKRPLNRCSSSSFDLYWLIVRFISSQKMLQKNSNDNRTRAARLEKLTWLTYNENKSRKTHTHPFNGPFSRTTRVSRYQKGNTNLDFTEARDS